MMAPCRLFVVYVVLCTVLAVHSYTISGRIHHYNGVVSEVDVSNYIDGENWNNIDIFTLDRLVGAKTLPTLTLVNFNYIDSLILTNISLAYVPVFVNTSCSNMTITGNKLISVPANAFSEPQPTDLDLSNNEIQSMADRSVHNRARDLKLRCNKLSHFSQSWFEDPGGIQILALDGNRIEFLQDRAFNQMTKLRWLFLSYNRITSIGSEAFSSGLDMLHLDFNDIAQLSPNIVAHRKRPISYLRLHHNQLSYLPEALLLKLKPKRISLMGNPWQCQCLRNIERWLRELNSTRYDIRSRRGEPVCVMPRNFVDVCIPVVDTELQQTYAKGLSPVPEWLASPCKQCSEREKFVKLT